ncbi:DUF2567 domain-containing protein [Streptomyces sp. NPDC006307]|uniref:DUF2567 domain-containing protein n=1 Tax=Streptomyces sp. NPDC006307 TaxID=3156748 RepID=UPI0033BED390
MTAPLTPPTPPTPPHQPSPQDPAWPPPYPSAATKRAERSQRADGAPDMAAEVRQGALVTACVMLAGVALGLLWLWLAPRIGLVSDGKAVFVKDTEGEGAVGADGTFTLLGLVFGALSAAAVFWFTRRHGGIAVVVGLALGGLLGSLLGWGVGTLLGPTHDVVAHARAVGPGVTFDAPLELNAHGALLAWPVAAMLVHLALAALFMPRDPDPEPYPYPDPYPSSGWDGAYGPTPPKNAAS